MKKVFFILACVLVMGATLTSCNKDKQQCYKVTYNLPGGSAAVVYKWTTANLMETEKARLEKLGYTDIKYSVASQYKTVEECVAQNVQQ